MDNTQPQMPYLLAAPKRRHAPLGRKHWKPEQDATLIDMWGRGHSPEEIGARLSRTPAAVTRRAAVLNLAQSVPVTLRPRRNPWPLTLGIVAVVMAGAALALALARVAAG